MEFAELAKGEFGVQIPVTRKESFGSPFLLEGTIGDVGGGLAPPALYLLSLLYYLSSIIRRAIAQDGFSRSKRVLFARTKRTHT